MRSADSRRRFEWTARIVALAALLWVALESTDRPSLGAMHVAFDSIPSPADRDGLAALRRAGVPVSWQWRHTPPVPVAISADPLADPVGLAQVAVAAPPGTPLAIVDGLGVLDSAVAAAGGATFVVPAPVDAIAARVSGAHAATASVHDSLTLRPLLVLGTVGWETKFVIRALEERGWTVDARLALAPRHDVVQGRRAPIDTAHYAAVVAIDSGARGSADAVIHYARSGGGVIIAGSAARALPAIAPARLGDWRNVRPLSYFRLLGPPAVGRIAQVGYDDTWRRRMGSATGPQAHRDWWAALVASVAYAPRSGLPPVRDDPAPVAATIDRLGAPRPSQAPTHRWPPGVWFALAMGALLTEWTSRRLRGTS